MDDKRFKYIHEINWIGNEPWLENALNYINERYKKLNINLAHNRSWNDSQRCEHLAHHYYDLACYYNDELFGKYRIDLESVRTCVERCLENLKHISKEGYSHEVKELKRNAKKLFNFIEKTYKEHENLLANCEYSDKEKYINVCLSLGSLDKSSLKKYIQGRDKKGFEQQIQNIQLLRTIHAIEDLIDTSETKKAIIIVQKSYYLARLYRLAGQFSLYETCIDAAENLMQKVLNSAEIKKEDEKQIIKNIINRELVDNNSNLTQIKKCIEKTFHKSPSSLDNIYIQRKYIKYCSKLWLIDVIQKLKEFVNENSKVISEELLNSLDSIYNLEDIPNIFQQLRYTKLLIVHHELLNKRDEDVLVDLFKKECLERVIEYSSSAKRQLFFLLSLDKFLSASRNLQSIITELKLKDFYDDKISYKIFIKNVMLFETEACNDNLAALKQAAKPLEQEEDFVLKDKFINVIQYYIQPLTIRKEKIDNRQVLEVRGTTIVISEILDFVKQKLFGIEEVHFIGLNTIYIDADLDNKDWHGMNIAVLTKVINVSHKVSWNVSGKDNDHSYSDIADTGEDGNGKRGKDGYAGESGGNVLVLAQKIEFADNLTTISNGGMGSKGQNGGKGRDGENGKSLGIDEFKNTFNPPASCEYTHNTWNLFDTIRKIKKDLQKVDTEWLKIEIKDPWISYDKVFEKDIISKVIEKCNDLLTPNRGLQYFPGNIFIDAKTNQGNEIIFSYLRSTEMLTVSQAFLLYKGSEGQPGGKGGEYGLGGQGGYAGEIIVRNLQDNNYCFNIKKKFEQGKNGEIGEGGDHGRYGKNGWDVAYIDYAGSALFTGPWPKFYGTDENSKLEIEYWNANASNRIWCPYRQFIGNSYQYAKFVSSSIDNTKHTAYAGKNKTRESTERERHALATRKKNISQSTILGKYSSYLQSANINLLQNLQSDMETINREAARHASKSTIENQAQENVTERVRVKYYVNFNYLKKQQIATIIKANLRPAKSIQPNAEDLIASLLEKKSKFLNDIFKFKNVELNLLQTDFLFSIFELIKQKNTKKENLRHVNEFLINKYGFVICQEIAKQLSSYQVFKVRSTKVTPEFAARYLIESSKNDNNFSHNILRSLNQYFIENNIEHREKISIFCIEELKKDSGILKNSMKAFILEVGSMEGSDIKIRHYYNDFKRILEKQKISLNARFEAFKGELCRLRHAKTFTLFIDSLTNNSLKSDFNNRVQKDKLLATLYNNFNNKLKVDYPWDICCQDESIMKAYYEHLKEEGPLSSSYRELLADVFNVNIRVYVIDQKKKLLLHENHNPSSNQSTHILYRNNKFIQLCINEDYLKLDEDRKRKDEIYGQVLVKIDSFKEKQEFDTYLVKKHFLSERANEKSEALFYNKLNLSEKDNLGKMIDYFPEEEKQQLKFWLEKITFQYIGQQGILYSLLKRFTNEGRHIPTPTLCHFINCILISNIEDRKENNIFCWIIAAFSQKNWIDQLILVQLENQFKMPLENKLKWHNYLAKIENKDLLLLFSIKLSKYGSNSVMSTESIEEILYLLSETPNETITLDSLALSEWSYALKERYWTLKLSQLADWEGSEKLQAASYYLLHVENTFGTTLIEKFMNVLEEKKERVSSDTITNILYNFYSELWNLSEEELNIFKGSNNIGEWEKILLKKFIDVGRERNMTDLFKLIKGNANTSKEILDNLSRIRDIIRKIYDHHTADGTKMEVNNFTENDIKNWVKVFQKHEICKNLVEYFQSYRIPFQNEKSKCKELGEYFLSCGILPIVDQAIKLKRGFNLRDAQKLSIILLLINDHNTLAQVSTGEGKSLIVVSVSIIKALCGEKVDIITSSSVLAERDAEENKDIFTLFDIKVSHNCSEDVNKRKEVYSGNQVVYGDLSNFQRDYLLDKFYGQNILGDRNFESVIVDEVDSMLLDKGNNMLYLSHDIAGFDKLESVYIYIWNWINRPALDYEELSHAFNSEAIKEAVLNDVHGLIRKEHIKNLDAKLTYQQVNDIWNILQQANILDSEGKLLKSNINDGEIKGILSSKFDSHSNRLIYLLNERIHRQKYIHAPNQLVPFIEQHLESWINNAIMAFTMIEGQDYVVDVDRTATSPDRHPNITILDRDTGTDLVNSQWSDGLHQFLQLKHGCKLSLQSLKTVFISNVSFFKLYKNLHGLTGTLGSYRERNLLRGIYNVDFVIIPTAKAKQFYEEQPILCPGQQAWINKICHEVKQMTEEKHRSVLIICDTVNDVTTLFAALESKGAKNVRAYTRDYEKFDIVQGTKKLEQGQIIIATNLAGRGTDIKIADELKNVGGLHVCLTYLPNNIRIEQQAFGRAARHGDKGSGQLITVNRVKGGYDNFTILELKKKRDADESQRISYINSYYETQIREEEYCFKKFKEEYERLDHALDDSLKSKVFETRDLKDKSELKKILLQSCLDKWIFWLDKNSEGLKNIKDEKNKNDIKELLGQFISDLHNLRSNNIEDLFTWVNTNPIQMIKLGKYFIKDKTLETAIRLFNKAIELEPYFCEAAHYYKTFALSKKINWEEKPRNKHVIKAFKTELRKAEKLFDEHNKFSMVASGMIGKMKKNNDKSIIQINAFKEQQKNLSNIYSMFLRSVDDILGHPVSPQSFLSYDIKYEIAESLYEGLLKEGILKRPKVKKNITKEELKRLSFEYGIPVEELKDFCYKYEGKKMNQNEFQKELKEKIQLPSRELFWKKLREQQILSEEINYIIVNSEKLREFDFKLFEYLLEKVESEQDLERQTLESCNKNNHIFLYEEQIAQQKIDENILKKNDLIKIIGKHKYFTLKKAGVVSFNKRACINNDKIENVNFSCYDSITPKDFIKINIPDNEAKIILTELIKQNVLIEKQSTSKNSVYELNGSIDQIEKIKLSFCPIYESAVKRLMLICFAFKIALQNIEIQIERKEFPLKLRLMAKPHKSMLFELIDQKIVKPVTVVWNEKKIIEATVAKVLGITLAKEDRVNYIVKILERYCSSLKVLKVPDLKLKCFTEFLDSSKFGDIVEVQLFFLNGLDQLLQSEEMKWTNEMLWGVATVVVMGICQIVIGVVLELFSAGVLAQLGAAFINEGVGELFFASSCLISGYFSWEDYRQHKLISLIITFSTFGLGALFSRGAQVSTFGQKLSGPGFEFGKTVTTMSVSGKQIFKRVLLKTAEGLFNGLADAAVDKLIENYLYASCKAISSKIFSDIMQNVEEHSISVSLEKAYRVLGQKRATEMIDYLCTLTKLNYIERFLPVAQKVASSIINGYAEAAKKRSMTVNKAQLPVQIISQILFSIERFAHIDKIATMTKDFLDDLDKKIKSEINEYSRIDKKSDNNDEDYKKFKKEVIAKWKDLLSEKAKFVIAHHIIGPIAKEGLKSLALHIGKQLEKLYRSTDETDYFKQFDELKQEHKKELRKVRKQQMENPAEVKTTIMDKFHENLLKLASKIRNPALFAAIIRERIPMDLICVGACTLAIPQLLMEIGVHIPGLTIEVVGDSGIRQTFDPPDGRVDKRVVTLLLKDNHFQFSLSSTSSTTETSMNDCLYNALLEAIPELSSISADYFRERIAYLVENNYLIGEQIRQGLHGLSISLGAYGGAVVRRPSNRVRDEDSSTTNELNRDFWIRVRPVHRHLIARFLRFPRYGGMRQRISEATDLSRNELTVGHTTRYQDQNSGRGMNVHASHVIRDGMINAAIGTNWEYVLGDSSEFYNELRNFLGHTQNVPRYANDFRGLGGDIDQFQSKYLTALSTIDFSRSLTAEDANTLEIMRGLYVEILDKWIEEGESSETEVLELLLAREYLMDLGLDAIFEQGRRGYLGKNQEQYKQKYDGRNKKK